MEKHTSKTYKTRTADVKRQWHVVDASDQTLGRLSSRIACLLMGKHKPIFSHNEDTGDFVVVINAAKVRVTGSKAGLKLYERHTGHPGGFKSTTFEALMAKDPRLVVTHAVEGMLPHTYLSAKMKKRLRVYAGDTYPDLPQVKPVKTEPVGGEA